MTKFGDLVNVDVPVLLDFYKNWSQEDEYKTATVLKQVVGALGDKAKVIKIDIAKNEMLAEALDVNEDPTFIIYKYGKIIWRESGMHDASTLISTIEQYA